VSHFVSFFGLFNLVPSALGVYHGTLNFDSTSDNFIDSGHLLPYPTFFEGSGPAGTPSSMALTEFHFVFLYGDRVVGVCNLDKKQTYEESLPLVRVYESII
jgi:hypothetical protein